MEYIRLTMTCPPGYLHTFILVCARWMANEGPSRYCVQNRLGEYWQSIVERNYITKVNSHNPGNWPGVLPYTYGGIAYALFFLGWLLRLQAYSGSIALALENNHISTRPRWLANAPQCLCVHVSDLVVEPSWWNNCVLDTVRRELVWKA